MHRKLPVFLLILTAGLLVSCQGEKADAGRMVERKLPIINGTQVTGDDYLATVGVVLELNPGDYRAFCTGALIDAQHILTAAHCVADCNDGSESQVAQRPMMRIGIGQTIYTFRHVAQIADYYIHPDYLCDDKNLLNDIAVLKLTEPVPENVVKPAHAMSRALDISVSDVDGENKIATARPGYGRTDAKEPISSGQKFVTIGEIAARCPLEGEQSEKCGKIAMKDKGFLYFDATQTGTCLGDSGGPVLIQKGGMEFVIGVTSYGYDDCKIVDATVNVSDYEDFIGQYVKLLTELPPENCTNQIDDDGDGLVDCDDDDCAEACASSVDPDPDEPPEKTDPDPDEPPEKTDPDPDEPPEKTDPAPEDPPEITDPTTPVEPQNPSTLPEDEQPPKKSGGCSIQPVSGTSWGWLGICSLLGLALRRRKYRI